ncbi:hypothetical protein BOTBODRAFT_146628 [Botryobasidium botryosum FD-172 SS1]|uniref:Uncharacterized protein n=1 Tax=Botryobasidium botryosum (strain FD-172 SS1) TaxID=930990 RepID=A0A067MD54_BOTB1|nr:hypothetical protein BOTBODRAFT_146628 [Botryobasidium botryosum FD-172 SS1]
MMLTAQGTVQNTDGSGFTANFPIDGYIYEYVGTFAPGETVPAAFLSVDAKASYSDITILHGEKQFTGWVGPKSLSFSVAGSTSISGSLFQSLPSSYQVNGTGEWSKKSIKSYSKRKGISIATREDTTTVKSAMVTP